MPLHRRVPKRGFNSRLARQTAKVRLSDIAKLQRDDPKFAETTLDELKARGVIPKSAKRARIYSGARNAALSRAAKFSGGGILVSKPARDIIKKAGGEVAIS